MCSNEIQSHITCDRKSFLEKVVLKDGIDIEHPLLAESIPSLIFHCSREGGIIELSSSENWTQNNGRKGEKSVAKSTSY